MTDLVLGLLGPMADFFADLISWAIFLAGAAMLIASYTAPMISVLAGPLGALLSGPVGAFVRVVGVVLLVVGGARIYAGHEVNLALATAQMAANKAVEDAAKLATAEVAAAKDREAAAALKQIQAAHAQEVALLQKTAQFKQERISHVPVNPACAVLPAAGAALGELRARRLGANASAGLP
jgi:hypothetical protein